MVYNKPPLSLAGSKTTPLPWQLLVKEPQAQSRLLSFDQPTILIGRASHCDLQLQDRFASAEHAKLTFAAAGLVLLTDLKSANGTYVNGKNITEVYVRAQDQIMMGKTIISIHGDGKAETAQSQEITAVVRDPHAGSSSLPKPLIAALRQSGKALSRDLTLKESLQIILESAIATIEADCGFILLKNPEQGYTLATTLNFTDPINQETLKSNVSLAIAQAVCDHNQSFYSANLKEDAQFGNHPDVKSKSLISVLCTPLTHNQQAFGAIYLDRRGIAASHKSVLSNDHRTLYEIFSTLSSVAVQQSHLRDELAQEIRTRTTMQRYISPQVVEQVLSKKHQHMLGGSELKTSVLFSDIRGFTKFSGQVEPARLIEQLNEYFSVMAKVILAHEGFLDKFIGDAIMAVFGVPTPRDDDAKRAILSALEMQRRLHQLNGDWQKRGWQPFQMGIGINTGRVISGNIGSTQRMEYTVIGDTVNVASRLCSAAEAGQVIVAASCTEGIESFFDFSAVALPELKGKEREAVRGFLVKGIK